MRFIKRMGWQTLSLAVTLLYWLRYPLFLTFALLSVVQLFKILDIVFGFSDENQVPILSWILLGLFVVGFFGSFYMAQPLLNAREIIKDKILLNTKFHFSKEKIAKFKRDMLAGNTDHYTFHEIFAMTRFLEQQGETVSANLSHIPSMDTTSETEINDRNTEPQEGNKAEEDVISTRELKNFIREGVSDPVAALSELIGLANVKEQVLKMYNRYLFERKRQEAGTKTEISTCNHMCFSGPAGTGKTSVARIMSSILYDLKVIRKNQVLEICGTDLQGQYVGYTAKRTKRIIEAARGGVLFVDEAYSLMESKSSYAGEALGELVKAMEDLKDDLVVIFAGYEEEMKQFVKQNSGMESRIKTYLYFSDYTPSELAEIFVSMAKKVNYEVTRELVETYKDYAEKILIGTEGFGNARTVRMNLDETVEKHADNYLSGKIDKSMINVLSLADFPYFKNSSS